MRKAWLTSSLGTCTAVLIAAGLAVAGPAFAADSTVTVTKDGEGGWAFNRDPNNVTPYEFTTDGASTGNGNLYVAPIGSNGPNKFIAEQFLMIPASQVESIWFDYLIAGNGATGDSDDFYLNVYTILPGSSSTYYDCRFDYVASGGSTEEFMTAGFTAEQVPTRVVSRGGAACPATLAGMDDGTVRFFSLNVGQSTASDTGLAGYLDNVVVSTDGGSTAYDFEDRPVSKDECKNDGWMRFEIYMNQGECVAWLNSPKG